MQSIYKELEDGRQLLYAWFPAMHSRVDLIVCNRPEAELKAIAEEISDKLADIEQIGNYHNASSELCRVNACPYNKPLVISKELFGIVSDCVAYHKKTLGYFDITVKSEQYSKDMVNAIELSADDSSIFFKKKGIRLDLSGYLKGYGLEQIREILNRHAVENALINMGNSSVMAIGNHPYGKGWKISGTEDRHEITLHNQCYTTSGNENQKRKHIINPQTGKPVEGKRQISVVTAKGTDGEALSTALFAADAEEKEHILINFKQ